MIHGNKKIVIAAVIALFLITGAFFMVNVEIPPSLAPVSAINVVLFTIPAFWACVQWLGKRDAIILITALGIYALAIESIGLLTGFPYGQFSHADIMGYKLFGVVPWTVAFAWSPLILAAVAIARRTIESLALRLISVAVILTAFDLVLDPGAVYLKFWSYPAGGTFYSVPWTNFAGWLLSGFIGACIAELLLSRFKPLLPAPVQLIISTFFTLVFWTAIAAWAGLIIPAVLGIAILISLGIFYKKYYYAFDDMIVFVDEANRPLATAPKLASHTGDTKLHRAFSVFLFNENGELLLQQRGFSKKTWPGIWSNSCCGHLMLHESAENAAHRRLKYELGLGGVKLEMMLPEYRYRAEKDGIVENEICPVMVGKLAKKPKLNPLEVAETKWVKWEAFLDEVNSDDHPYSPWAAEEAKLLNENKEFQDWLKTVYNSTTPQRKLRYQE